MICVILAGGKGTRISNEYPDIPKAMIPILGKPVLEYEIEFLKHHGVNEIIIITGYLHSVIENYFKDGSSFGVKISYYQEMSPLGTGGALFNIEFKEDFLLCAGDLIFNFSLDKMIDFHKSKNALATIFSHPSRHPFDSTLIKSNSESQVVDFFCINDSIDSFENNCSAGIYIISPKLLDLKRNKFQGDKCDLDKDILYESLFTNRIYAYKSIDFVWDTGTPERIIKAEQYLSSVDLFSVGNSKKKRAVFLDRDGTINTYKGYITNKNDVELIDKSAEAIDLIHSLGYLVILVTNQPVVARGDCSIEELTEINERVQYLLGEHNSYLDDIYFCPHHPEQGFENEDKKFKVDCSCRKPKPGMIFKAAEKYNIDLTESYMVGDSKTDVYCAVNAGCMPVFVENDRDDIDFKNCLKMKDLYSFAQWLLKNKLNESD